MQAARSTGMVAVALAGAWAAGPVAARDAWPVEVRARIPVARQGELAPVQVEVHAAGAAVAGTIRLWWDGPGSMVAVQKFELAAGGRKVYPFLARHGRLMVRVDGPDGEPSSATRDVLVSQEGRRGDLIGVEVGSDVRRALEPPTRLRVRADASGGRDAVHVRWSPLEVPEQTRALDFLDYVILDDLDGNVLTVRQVAAIRGWVERGGSLVVIGGRRPGRLRGSALDPLLPVELEDATVMLPGAPSLDRLSPARPGPEDRYPGQGRRSRPVRARGGPDPAPHPLEVARARIRPGGEVLAAEGDLVLLARRVLGRGEVMYLGWDPEAGAFADKERRVALWRAVLPRPRFLEPEDPRLIGAEPFLGLPLNPLAIWGGLHPDDPASLPIVTLMVLIAVYFLAVGPLQYLVLSRLRALPWAWVVTPSLSLLFCFAAFALGYLRHGGVATLSELAVLHGRTGHRTWSVHHFGRVYSAFGADYDVRLGRPDSVTELFDLTGGDAGGPDCELRLEDGSLHPTGVRIPIWSNRSFHASAILDDGPDLRVDARPASSLGYRLRIENRGSFPIRRPILAEGDLFAPLEDIPPGAVVETVVPLGERIRDAGIGWIDSQEDLTRDRLWWRAVGREIDASGRRGRPLVLAGQVDLPDALRFEVRPMVRSRARLGLVLLELERSAGRTWIAPRDVIWSSPSLPDLGVTSVKVGAQPLELWARLLRFPDASVSFAKLTLRLAEPGPDLQFEVFDNRWLDWKPLPPLSYISLDGYRGSQTVIEPVADVVEPPLGSVRLRIRSGSTTPTLVTRLELLAERHAGRSGP